MNQQNERAELLKLLSQHDLLNGHVSEVDHQSYRIQYELALLEDKSREVRVGEFNVCWAHLFCLRPSPNKSIPQTFELVDNFLARVNQIR